MSSGLDRYAQRFAIDTVRSLLHRSPKTVAMVGPSGAVAVFSGAEDYEVSQLLAASAPDGTRSLPPVRCGR